MSLISNPLTGDWQQQTVASGVGVHVWRERNLGTIWIATRQVNRPWESREQFVRIEVALLECENETPQHPLDKEQISLSGCARLSLNISAALIEKAGMRVHAGTSSTIAITDPIAFELTLGVVEAYALPHINEYTRRSMVAMLCAQLSETVPSLLLSARRRSQGLEPWQRRRLESALSEVCKSDISLELIANRCGLSVCHFARLFKATYGMPFHQYSVQRRISHACALLSQTQESIAQIALDCGFSDQSSFTRRFSSKTGSSPAAWRKGLLSQPHRSYIAA